MARTWHWSAELGPDGSAAWAVVAASALQWLLTTGWAMQRLQIRASQLALSLRAGLALIALITSGTMLLLSLEWWQEAAWRISRHHVASFACLDGTEMDRPRRDVQGQFGTAFARTVPEEGAQTRIEQSRRHVRSACMTMTTTLATAAVVVLGTAGLVAWNRSTPTFGINLHPLWLHSTTSARDPRRRRRSLRRFERQTRVVGQHRIALRLHASIQTPRRTSQAIPRRGSCGVGVPLQPVWHARTRFL